MLDKLIDESLHFIMKYAGRHRAWAGREHVKILKRKQGIQHEKIIGEQEKDKNEEELKSKEGAKN